MANVQKKATMAGVTLFVAEPALSLMHQGAIGTIVGLGLGLGAFVFADDIERIMGGSNPFPQPIERSANKNIPSYLYRALNGKSVRGEMGTSAPNTQDDGIDPDILAMLRSGDTDGAVSLAERARAFLSEELGEVPSFKQLLEDQTILKAIKKKKLLLGYIDGEPRYGTLEDLYSCGIGGASGSGKSTTVRSLLYQLVLSGCKLVMVDPHIQNKNESLAYEFSKIKSAHIQECPPCDGNEQAVLVRVRYLAKEYKYRKNSNAASPKIVFVLDEYNALIRNFSEDGKQELTSLILTISQEARKFGIYVMIIAQRWSENDLGGKNCGAAIRSSLSSRICHRFSDEDNAKRFISGHYGAKALRLAKGHFFFSDTNGEIQEMITPQTTRADGATIRRMLMPVIPTSPVLPPTSEVALEDDLEDDEEVELEVDAEVAEEVTTEYLPGVIAPLSDRELKLERVRELTKAKRLQSDIIALVWNVPSKGGTQYKKAAEEYREILSAIIS
jgi:hypothetical protein